MPKRVHEWSETYEREIHGIFAVQDEITCSIVDALKLKLEISPAPRSGSTDAYDLYLQGLFLSDKSTEEGLRGVWSSSGAHSTKIRDSHAPGPALQSRGSGWPTLTSNRSKHIRRFATLPKCDQHRRR